jgi:hypothetical protein
MLTMWHLLSAKVANHFADKRRSLGRSVGIVRSRTQTMEFSFLVFFLGFIFRTVEDVGFEFIAVAITKHSVFQGEYNMRLFHKVLCRHVPVANSRRKISIFFFGGENICLSYAHVYPSPYLL